MSCLVHNAYPQMLFAYSCYHYPLGCDERVGNETPHSDQESGQHRQARETLWFLRCHHIHSNLVLGMRTKTPTSPFLNIIYPGLGDSTMYHSQCTNGNRCVNVGKHSGILFSERCESSMIVFTLRWETLKTTGLWLNESRAKTNTKLERGKKKHRSS